ncbi:MAG: type III pantothenate kinase [Bacteroidia bacterium]|nr:type III pantothenate kinase [Bacteroidia bacterium]
MAPQIHLTIDNGNTSTKVVVFADDVIRFRKVYTSFTAKDLKSLYLRFKPDASIISSVTKLSSALLKFLRSREHFLDLSGKTPVPLKMSYKTPQTLGTDRLAGIVGVSKLFPKQNVLVIDLGTCIKYDFLSKKNKYIGGSISPGLNMRLKALHDYTGRLPLLKPSSVKGFEGSSTKESILSGVQVGIVAEMEGFISRYKKKYGLVKIVLTGGDAHCFAGQLKMSIFAAPDLVSIGLNEILIFNAESQ